MKILFCGGGTLGPVTPLIAVLRRMRLMRPDSEFVWIGTPHGPEAPLVEAEEVSFHSIPVAKLSRHVGLDWLSFPFDYLRASKAAKLIIRHEAPDAVFSAGGYTQVPVIRAAAKRGITCAIHQLDATPIRSNLAVARFCRKITTSFAYPAVKPFGNRINVEQVAIPCRFSGVKVPSREEACERLGVDPKKPILFVTGGGTGALSLNQALLSIADELLGQMQIVHQVGRGKGSDFERDGYLQAESFDEAHMLAAYVAADLVVSRAGFGALSELATLHKAVIAVPLPNSPQSGNVERLMDSLVVVEQGDGFSHRLRQEVVALMDDEQKRVKLGDSLAKRLKTDDGSALAKLWLSLLRG